MVNFKATGVNKRYGEVVALDNMNFSLEESEIHYLCWGQWVWENHPV